MLALALSALALCGCGRDGDRREAQAVTQRFFSALQSNDGSLACAQLSADARDELESQQRESCQKAITGLGLQGAGITRVQVFVTDAVVDLADGDTVFLGDTPAGWRLSAVGCKPQAGKPAGSPLRCALQT
jgi:hypothetical protein